MINMLKASEAKPRSEPAGSTTGGFTLIEIMVAVGIFSILLLIIVGIFSRFVFTQRRDIAEQHLQEDIRLAFELFNREARTAYGSTYSSDGSDVYFRNQNGTCVTYRVQAAILQRAEATLSTPAQPCQAAEYASYLNLTSRQTHFTTLQFSVQPALVEGTLLRSQGFITLIAEASATGKADTTLTLQSTVASRQLIPYAAP